MNANGDAPKRWHALALLLPAGIMLLGLWLAPEPAPPPPASEAQRQRIAGTQRRREPGMRRHAMRRFTADPWSQEDEFAHTESIHARTDASTLGVSVGSVLDSIDADVRDHPDLPGRPKGERGDVFPCTPRVFYR